MAGKFGGRWKPIAQLRDEFRASGRTVGDLAPEGARGCRGKVRHVDEDAANEHVKRLIRDGGREPEKLGVYRCVYCRFWHVGHNNR